MWPKKLKIYIASWRLKIQRCSENRELNQERSKPDPVNRYVRTAHSIVYHNNTNSVYINKLAATLLSIFVYTLSAGLTSVWKVTILLSNFNETWDVYWYYSQVVHLTSLLPVKFNKNAILGLFTKSVLLISANERIHEKIHEDRLCIHLWWIRWASKFSLSDQKFGRK